MIQSQSCMLKMSFIVNSFESFTVFKIILARPCKLLSCHQLREAFHVGAIKYPEVSAFIKVTYEFYHFLISILCSIQNRI